MAVEGVDVSTRNGGTNNGALLLPLPSMTTTEQLLCTPSANASNTIVFTPLVAVPVREVQFATNKSPGSLEVNVNSGVLSVVVPIELGSLSMGGDESATVTVKSGKSSGIEAAPLFVTVTAQAV